MRDSSELVDELIDGFRALRLYPVQHLYTVRDRCVLDPVFERAATARLPVYWTPGEVFATYLPLVMREYR